MSTTQFCTFFVEDLFFGIDVTKVQEVLRYQEMTRVPLAPKVVRGLINLRGQIVTAIDLRTQLGLEPNGDDSPPMNVVVYTERGTVSLLVDQVGDVVVVDNGTYERTPDTVPKAISDVVPGVHKLKDSLMLVLDTDKTTKAVSKKATLTC